MQTLKKRGLINVGCPLLMMSTPLYLHILSPVAQCYATMSPPPPSINAVYIPISAYLVTRYTMLRHYIKGSASVRADNGRKL